MISEDCWQYEKRKRKKRREEAFAFNEVLTMPDASVLIFQIDPSGKYKILGTKTEVTKLNSTANIDGNPSFNQIEITVNDGFESLVDIFIPKYFNKETPPVSLFWDKKRSILLISGYNIISRNEKSIPDLEKKDNLKTVSFNLKGVRDPKIFLRSIMTKILIFENSSTKDLESLSFLELANELNRKGMMYPFDVEDQDITFKGEDTQLHQ